MSNFKSLKRMVTVAPGRWGDGRGCGCGLGVADVLASKHPRGERVSMVKVPSVCRTALKICDVSSVHVVAVMVWSAFACRHWPSMTEVMVPLLEGG